MDVAQPPQRPFSERVVIEAGNEDRPFITDDHILDRSGPVDKQSDLSSDFAGQVSHLAGKFRGDRLRRRHPAAVQPFKGLELAGLEAVKITVELFYRAPRRTL